MKAEEIDHKFDNNEDITEHLELSSKRRPNQNIKRINIDFPEWMINALDDESSRIGVTRQSIVKMWISQKIDTL